jgi:formylglycine-generating enzyme required for sulfatase activity
MASLAELPNLVGFFSYSREDDEDFRGELSAIRAAIGRNLAALLGRSKRQNFHLWQDVEAIAPGKLWETEIAKAIEEAVFFIPIVTPRAVQSPYCKSEFESFLARERAIARNDLVFPILYLPVPALRDEAKRRNDRVLTIVAERQFVDWRSFRHVDVNTTAFGQEIGRFCEKIAEALHETCISPDERRELEAEAKRRAKEEERLRQAEERVREAMAKKRAEREARESEQGEAKRRAEEQEQERQRKEALAKRHASPLTATEERALQAGDSFKEGADCPEMIVVPAGRFLMGSPAGQGEDTERPQHEVTIAKPFAVAKFALTFDEWDACAAQGGCRSDVDDHEWGRGRRPVVVNWDEAQAYVKWLSRSTGRPYRLLSEAEYEYATRAGSQTIYPWGDDIKLNGEAMANCDGCGSQWGGEQTAPVGSFPANAFGLYDMVGNLRAWTEDCWNVNYQGAPADGSPWTTGDCSRRVVRGGSWAIDPDQLRSAVRYGIEDAELYFPIGIRAARTLTP